MYSEGIYLSFKVNNNLKNWQQISKVFHMTLNYAVKCVQYSSVLYDGFKFHLFIQFIFANLFITLIEFSKKPINSSFWKW